VNDLLGHEQPGRENLCDQAPFPGHSSRLRVGTMTYYFFNISRLSPYSRPSCVNYRALKLAWRTQSTCAHYSPAASARTRLQRNRYTRSRTCYLEEQRGELGQDIPRVNHPTSAAPVYVRDLSHARLTSQAVETFYEAVMKKTCIPTVAKKSDDPSGRPPDPREPKLAWRHTVARSLIQTDR